MKLLFGLMLVFVPMPMLCADEAFNLSVEKSSQGTMEITVDGKSDHHYILYRSLDLAEQGEAIAMELGHDAPVHLKDRFAPMPKQVFYRVRAVRNAESGDTDGDGIDDGHDRGTPAMEMRTVRGNPRENAIDCEAEISSARR